MLSTLCLLLTFLQPPTAKAERILFIGNSYTYSNDLPGLVAELYLSAKLPKPSIENIMMAGASLGDHWKNPKTKQRIIEGSWTYIIMQQGPTSLASSQKELQADLAMAKPWLEQSKAKPAMFMVWPDTTRRRFLPQVRKGYADGAKSNEGLFLPAGVAWKELLEKQPKLELYSGDGLHPTPLGTYVAGLVITCKLTNLPPERFPTTIVWGDQRIELTSAQKAAIHAAVYLALRDEGK